ncbi:regulator of G-protein signaling 5-like isoform X2 [Boleophthalmus pectinirostris]|uniref:regulator of G-protein signaling 5-like isoform X2 n=1 Tax=Boleophthalmus pectinirostris TaxID=150288 RepID=UPI00242F36FA|nr:regulator of G-protein signaling 5-like isoform X2 [Boleophthalmus pectinirostris]
MPKMLFSKIRFYDIKDLISGAKRPKRLDFILSRRAHKDEAVRCVMVRKMNHETRWKSHRSVLACDPRDNPDNNRADVDNGGGVFWCEATLDKTKRLKPDCTLQPSLEQLLQDKEYQRSFRSFLQSEYSEENLDFWLACEDFRTISSEEELQRRAQQIYQEFLLTTAKREVNVDHWIREKILVSLDKPSSSCFREAQKHVYALMEKDSWPRYTHSQKCQSLGPKVTHALVHLDLA